MNEELLTNLTGELKPQSLIQIMFKNGAAYKTTSVETPQDFMKIWKSKKGTVTIFTDANAYLTVNKKDVICVTANPKQ